MSAGIGNETGDPYIRSPRQASQIFGLEGARAPRQKNLFVVNFRKAGDTTSTGISDGTWNKDLGFLVKSVDRPSVDPKVEELNQYNKKRQVNTGYKIGTTRITVYDTADSMAMRMWAEYSKYYFGDFRHATQAATDWGYDVTLPTFQDTANGGYGFAPQASSSSVTDYNSQFFLDTVSVYQVFGGKYVQFDLVHPKITSFTPDALDYSASEIATYTITLACEAILYKNDFQPQAISGDPFLQEAFTSTSWFNGGTFEVPASDQVQSYTYPASNNAVASPLPYGLDTIGYAPTALRAYATTASTGNLNTYGNYNFGSTAPAAAFSSLAGSTDLATAALTNGALATALSLSSSFQRGNNGLIGTQPIGTVMQSPSYISQAEFDAARGAVQAVGGGLLQPGQQLDPQINQIINAATYAALSAGYAQGSSARDQVYNRQLPANGTDINSWSSASGTGLTLSSEAYGIMNAQRSPSSQVGFNARNVAQSPSVLPQATTPNYVKPASTPGLL